MNIPHEMNKEGVPISFPSGIDFTEDRENIQTVFQYELDTNEPKRIEEIISLFLADEFQLCTLSKFYLLQPYLQNKSKVKEPFKTMLAHLENQIIPVPMGIHKENIEYNFMALYDITQYLPQNKRVMIIKPIDIQHELRSDGILYLYENMESYLIQQHKCSTLSVFYNIGEKKDYTQVSAESLEEWQILEKNQMMKPTDPHDFIYIKSISLHPWIDEHTSFELLFSLLINSIGYLKKGGSLMIDQGKMNMSMPFMQMIYFLRTYFDKMRFVKTDIYKNDVDSGIFLFQDLKETFSIESCKNLLKTLFTKTVAQQIRKLKGVKMNSSFKKQLNQIYHEIFEHHKKYEEKRRFVEKEILRKKDGYKKFMDFMVEKSVDWCAKYKVLINSVYLKYYEKKIPDDLKESFFPSQKGVDKSKLMMTNESVYSVTFPREAEKISVLIKKYFPQCKYIVDTSANVGGNTINFSKNFEKVTSIEIDPETCDALKHNLSVYERTNVDVILGDYTKLKGTMNYGEDTVYFFDPPWGGIYYKLETDMDLYLSNINVIDILPKNFVLKAPINYNISKLLHKFKNIQIFYFMGFIVILPNYQISEISEVDSGYYY
jgi:predicted RNA methylase